MSGDEIKISREDLFERVWTRPMGACAAEFGISAHALAKVCDRMGVPYPSRGYWSKVYAGKFQLRPPLPSAPPGADAETVISPSRALSRRSRTRLTPAARQSQILDAAGRIITKEGLHAASMIRVAREVGISEAQIYNYFSSQEEMFIALARAEHAAANLAQQSEIQRGEDYLSRITLSTLSYLRQVEARGALLQVLLTRPEVRKALRSEHESRRTFNLRQMTNEIVEKYGVPAELAQGSNVILTAVALRAGRQLADSRAPLATVEQLSLWIILACTNDLILRRNAPASELAASRPA
ncbi:MAG: helix-turn-helix domain-containing protein [Phenylobacterium sp.]|uniref:TetR/AcrR family transcriptional regulator n=1 Tax=Phenylobacterium sp. TaxID=1871053 RepID=UPI0027338FE8|nr:TetR/AcrR family transcriptional regulator [Phenylobacterium sp.]MDP3747380.1 helix-turn-helix domain-containing protein [Phenylobacterium sp.]